MTKAELAQDLGLQFSNSTYYDAQAVSDSIQDGADEVCAFSGCLLKSAAVPFSQYQTYYDMISLIPDFIGVISIWSTSTKRWLSPTSHRKLSESRSDWDCQYGVPNSFCQISHRWVAISAKPATANYGSMLIFYRAAAPQLSVNSVLPNSAESAIENYCITDLWEQAQEWGKASQASSEYLTDLEQLRVLVQNKRNSDRLFSLK